MTAGTITTIIMSVAFAGLIGWDVYVAFFNRQPNREDTISGILLGWSKRVWILPYAFGVLGGHLFLPALFGPVVGQVFGVLVLVVSAALVTFAGIAIRDAGRRWPWQAPVLIVSGVLMGHLFWPQ
jgi:hypothetical protein